MTVGIDVKWMLSMAMVLVDKKTYRMVVMVRMITGKWTVPSLMVYMKENI